MDGVLHSIGLVIAPASGAVLFAAQTDLTSDLNPTVGALLGALTAGGIHAGRAAVRPFVTAPTVGMGNPAVSAAEDGTSLVMTVLAFVLPVLAFLLVVAVLGLIIWLVLRPALDAYPTLRLGARNSSRMLRTVGQRDDRLRRPPRCSRRSPMT